GGPVIPIGDPTGTTRPTVSIGRVTITGGVANTNPSGGDGFATGGGVEIIGGSGKNATGATVSISDSVVAGNRANPLAVVDDPVLCNPETSCAYAFGGGIDSTGTLTLTNTQVTDNVPGSVPGDPSVATEATGGGIYNHPGGTLTLRNSAVDENTAAVGLPNGQFSYGGGITSGGMLRVEDSTVSGNSSDVEAAIASSFFAGDTHQEASGGGLWLGEGSSSGDFAPAGSGNSSGRRKPAGETEGAGAG